MRVLGEGAVGTPVNALMTSENPAVRGFITNQLFRPRSGAIPIPGTTASIPVPINDAEIAKTLSRMSAALAADLFVPESEQ